MENNGKKILIVEDSKEFLLVLKQGFINEGFSVIAMEDGDDALIAAEKEKPDLILSDIVMPSMDGITMAKKLRESNIEAPIVFLTNMTDIKHIKETLLKDAQKEHIELNYIVKSDISVNSIVAKVKKKLNLD